MSNPHTTPSSDTVTRFYFDDCDMRGEIVTLHQTAQDATEHQTLPPKAQELLSEFLSAAALLAGILKFEGLLTLQIRGDGDVPLIMAEATHERDLRGIVKVNDTVEITDQGLRELTGDGVLTLTIDPKKGQRYQGIVPLEGNTIAECLSHYFTQSEQLPTKLWLFSNADGAGGFFLQSLPASTRTDAEGQDTWNTLTTLANTLTTQESLELTHEVQLTRLFHEFAVRVTSNQPTRFACSCSQERSEKAITAFGEQEAYAILDSQPQIDIDCEFCGQSYIVTLKDLDRIFKPTQH